MSGETPKLPDKNLVRTREGGISEAVTSQAVNADCFPATTENKAAGVRIPPDQTPKLLPCPFCGDNLVRVVDYVTPVFDFLPWSVVCQTCGAESKSTKTCDETIQLWNRRVPLHVNAKEAASKIADNYFVKPLGEPEYIDWYLQAKQKLSNVAEDVLIESCCTPLPDKPPVLAKNVHNPNENCPCEWCNAWRKAQRDRAGRIL